MLLRVRRDHFQVMQFAERQQRVASAAPGMPASNGGAHPGVLFDIGDALVEVAAAEKQVIEHGCNLVGSPERAGRQAAPGDCEAAGDREELSPGNHVAFHDTCRLPGTRAEPLTSDAWC